jgi:hypothetical protein
MPPVRVQVREGFSSLADRFARDASLHMYWIWSDQLFQKTRDTVAVIARQTGDWDLEEACGVDMVELPGTGRGRR